MKLTRFVPHFRSFKFAPFAVIALFAFTNLTGILFNRAYAPAVQAKETTTVAETVNIDSNVESDYIPADVPTSGDHELDLIIFRSAERYGVDPRLLHALIWQESKYKPHARSNVGAQGLMQLMPATASAMGVDDAFRPDQNISGGTAYLDSLLTRYHNNVALALAAYNAGPGAVDKYHGVPPYRETREYVARVIREFNRRKQVAAPLTSQTK